MKIVFASQNLGKIQELKTLLQPFHITLIPQHTLGVSEVPETALTFVENALIKARHVARCTDLPTLADDSGLCVEALQGKPGIYSARYAGLNSSAHDCMQKLLQQMKNVPLANRRAYFYCVLVLLKSADDPTPLICEGKWEGSLLQQPTGENGFGYDPIFYDDEHECSAAELPLDIKNRISHRGIAFRMLLTKLSDEGIHASIKCSKP